MCGQQTRVIAHDLGETTIEDQPERVVALEFSFVDALAAIGVSPVGIADDDDKERVIPQVRETIDDWTGVGLRQSPSLQVIAALNPDLIIADTRRHETIYGQLSGIAPTVSLPSVQAGYEENLESMRTIGAALDQCDAVDRRLSEHETAMADLAARVPPGVGGVMFGVTSDRAFTAHDAASYTAGVLQALGLEYALEHEGEDTQAEMNLETLVSINPAVLFVAGDQEASLVDEWLQNPLGQSLDAVASDTVLFIDGLTRRRLLGGVGALSLLTVLPASA
ncbi:MAG: ABC transporter substrate-binding protein [Egibacteraceae bacterium]